MSPAHTAFDHALTFPFLSAPGFPAIDRPGKAGYNRYRAVESRRS